MTMFEDVEMATQYWHLGVGSQYTIAYNEAYTNYQSVLKKDEEDQKARAEMLIAAAAILSTSVLTAVAAYGPMRRIAMRSALRTLGEQNTRAVLNLFNKSGTEPVLAFALGKSLDFVKGKANDKMKNVATQMLQNTASGISRVSPVSRGEEVRQLVGYQGLGIKEWIRAVQDNRAMSVGERDAALAGLSGAPFMNPPRTKIDINRLQPRIELYFYMQHILGTDYIVRHGPVGARMPSQRGGGISALPSDKSYPKDQSATAMAFYNTVEIDRPSFAIQEVTDKVHQEVYGRPFYTKERYAGFLQSPAGKEDELLRAERTLRDLSAKTRPGTIQAIQVA